MSSHPSKHALLYLRVSTDKQAEKGIAIPTQQERCVACAETNGYRFDPKRDVYVDRGESARTTNRPALLDLLNRCETDPTVNAVIVYDLSRLARDRIDFAIIKQTFKKHGIALISATEPINDSPEGQILEGILSAVAEFTSTQSARRIKLNMQRKARDGWWPTRAPYGYKNTQEKVATGKVRAWVEIDWAEAKWVVRAFELYGTGRYSIKVLAEKLDGEGFPTRTVRGKQPRRLHPSYIERILRDPFYVGVIKWGGVENPDGKHERFLDRSLFEHVQALLDARSGGTKRHRRLFSVFRGIAFCAECSSRMTTEEHTTSSGRTILYLRCMKRRRGEDVPCEQRYTHEEVYTDQLLHLLKRVELPKGFVERLRERIRSLFADEQKIHERGRKGVLDRIEAVQRKRKNLVLRLIETEDADPADIEFYKSIKADLEAEETRLHEELSRTEHKLAGVVRTIEIALSLAASCSYAFREANQPDLRALLVRTIFKRLEMRDGKIVRAVLNEPLDYLCYPRLKKHPVFYLASASGLNGSLIEYMARIARRNTRVQSVAFERCYERLRLPDVLPTAA